MRSDESRVSWSGTGTAGVDDARPSFMLRLTGGLTSSSVSPPESPCADRLPRRRVSMRMRRAVCGNEQAGEDGAGPPGGCHCGDRERPVTKSPYVEKLAQRCFMLRFCSQSNLVHDSQRE